jgi:hypothetical protein
LQSLPFFREGGAECVDESVVALCQGIGLSADGHTVEALWVEPVPGQTHQSQFGKKLVDGLSLCQATHIVEACVEHHLLTRITLDTASRLCLTLEHEHVSARLAEGMGACQTAESAAYDDDVVLHAFLFLSHL